MTDQQRTTAVTKKRAAPPPPSHLKVMISFHEGNAAEERHGPAEGHPECLERVGVCVDRLRHNKPIWRSLRKAPPRQATDEEILLCHTESHLSGISSVANMASQESKPRFLPKTGPVCMEGPCCEVRSGSDNEDTYVTAGSLQVARLSIGGLLTLVDAAFDERECRRGFALCRPPGHHASENRSTGFCLFNNIAIAASYAQKTYSSECSRVLIFDWDVHHAQGTQSIFEQSSSVLVVSAHRHDGRAFYPATGGANEVGFGNGKGYTVNVALPEGYGSAALWSVCEKVLVPTARKFRPDLILVSAGFDAASGDPLGGCKVQPSAFAAMTLELRRLAKELCQGRVLFALEGGYNLDVLPTCVEEVVTALVKELDPSDAAPFSQKPAWIEGGPCTGCIRRTCEAHHSLFLRLPVPESAKRRRAATKEKSRTWASDENCQKSAFSESPSSQSAGSTTPTRASTVEISLPDVKTKGANALSCGLSAKIQMTTTEMVIIIATLSRPPLDVQVSRNELRIWPDLADSDQDSTPAVQKWRFQGVDVDIARLRFAEYRRKKQNLTVRLDLGQIIGGAVSLEPTSA